VWSLGVVNFGLLVGLYTINFWMPQVIKGAGIGNPVSIGFVAALPALVGAIGMIFWSRHSDRTGDRTWHLLLSLFVAILGFSSAAATSDPAMGIGFLVLASLGIHSALPLFWSLPTAFLSGAGMAGGLALINSISNVGGYVGPQLMGYIKDQTSSFAVAFGLIACLLVVVAIIVFFSDASAVRRISFRRDDSRLGAAFRKSDHA
jgi:ACS family tartrate transporter-like MFS transporter